MTESRPMVTSDELHAYVDGALDAAGRARVEAHLKTSPEDAEKVRAYQRQNEALRALANTLELTPSGVAIQLRRRRIVWQAVRALPWAAAVAGLLFLGGAGGWFAHDTIGHAEKPELYQLAASSYRIYTIGQPRPVEIGANERDLLQRWLGSSLSAPFVAPELAQQGYQLVGGRLLSNTLGPAALLVYDGPKDANGKAQHLTIYVAPSSVWGEGKSAFEAVNGLPTFTWKYGPLWYSIAADLKLEEMRVMARSVNKQAITDLDALTTFPMVAFRH